MKRYIKLLCQWFLFFTACLGSVFGGLAIGIWTESVVLGFLFGVFVVATCDYLYDEITFPAWYNRGDRQ